MQAGPGPGPVCSGRRIRSGNRVPQRVRVLAARLDRRGHFVHGFVHSLVDRDGTSVDLQPRFRAQLRLAAQLELERMRKRSCVGCEQQLRRQRQFQRNHHSAAAANVAAAQHTATHVHRVGRGERVRRACSRGCPAHSPRPPPPPAPPSPVPAPWPESSMIARKMAHNRTRMRMHSPRARVPARTRVGCRCRHGSCATANCSSRCSTPALALVSVALAQNQA